MILLDTNILLRYVSRTDPSCLTVRSIIRSLVNSGETLCVVPQNLYEFWAVATRPINVNGLGLSIAGTDQEISDFLTAYKFLGDVPQLFVEWRSLVRAYNCQGKASYDARLVAAMRTHGVNRILPYFQYQRFRTLSWAFHSRSCGTRRAGAARYHAVTINDLDGRASRGRQDQSK